jgi:integrase
LAKLGTLTPDEARKLAAERLGAVAKGCDPSGERHALRKAMTVDEVCGWYLEEAAKGGIVGRKGLPIKASTLAMDRSRIDTHVRPLIGNKRADSLSDTDIARLQRDIASGKITKPRKGRGGLTTGGAGVAARTVRMLSAILEHAMRAKLVKANAARGVRQLAEGDSKRRLSETEIMALGDALRAAEAKGENYAAIAATRFLLMTGFRRLEALALRWDDIDLKARCVTLADSKSGRQVRSIGNGALAILEALPRTQGTPWVFPAGRGEGHFVGLPKVLAAIYAAASIEGASVHTLRHSFASVAGDEGFTEMTIAALLGHARKGVTQRYVKIDRSVALAADAVSVRIAGLLSGTASSGEIIPMRRAG